MLHSIAGVDNCWVSLSRIPFFDLICCSKKLNYCSLLFSLGFLCLFFFYNKKNSVVISRVFFFYFFNDTALGHTIKKNPEKKLDQVYSEYIYRSTYIDRRNQILNKHNNEQLKTACCFRKKVKTHDKKKTFTKISKKDTKKKQVNNSSENKAKIFIVGKNREQSQNKPKTQQIVAFNKKDEQKKYKIVSHNRQQLQYKYTKA